MIVFFNKRTGAISNVVTTYADEYLAWLDKPETAALIGDGWVRLNERVSIEEIEIIDGEFRRRQHMTIDHPGSSVPAGQYFDITGVPEGVSIQVNRDEPVVMDDSGVLEMNLEIPGQYRFRISGSGYVTKEFLLEAV